MESFDLRHPFLNPGSNLVVEIIHASEEDGVHGREIPGSHSVVETDGAMILNLAKMSTQESVFDEFLELVGRSDRLTSKQERELMFSFPTTRNSHSGPRDLDKSLRRLIFSTMLSW